MPSNESLSSSQLHPERQPDSFDFSQHYKRLSAYQKVMAELRQHNAQMQQILQAMEEEEHGHVSGFQE